MNDTIIQEEWRPVVGLQHYEVSSSGRVRSLDRVITARRRSGLTMMTLSGKVLRHGSNGRGYLRVCLRGDCRRIWEYVHRLVLTAFVGPCPDGEECCHWDGDPSNNHISNLRWGTRAGNCADSIRHGTMIRGERCGSAKLKEMDVHFARHWTKKGYARQHVGEVLGVSSRTIGDIVNGKCWAWLPEPAPEVPHE